MPRRRAAMRSISLVIPTLQAEPHLPELRAAIDAQSLPPGEVLVIDSSSDDRTVALASSFGWRTRVIARSEFDHGGTRNLGASLTDGAVLAFLTQDATPADDAWLANLVAPLGHADVAGTFSRQLPRSDARRHEAFAREQSYPAESATFSAGDVERIGIRALFFSNVSSATTREAFDRVGGFPDRVILNEDGYYAARLLAHGYATRYEATSRVLHSHDYGLGMQFRRYFDIGVSHADGPEVMRTARATGAGLRLVRHQLGHLLEHGAWSEAAFTLAEAGAKYAAYQLGRHHRRLPRSWPRHLGWNRRYWDDVARAPAP
jgi:rhamnosyltransferase